MKVLRDWEEVGASVNRLKEAGFPAHTDPTKCWDFDNIREAFSARVSRDASVVDLGCGPSVNGCMTLELLHAMGYRKLLGVDLRVPLYTRLAGALRGWRKYRTLFPYRVISSDITSTGLKEGSVDAAVLLSVVEHGVDLERLFTELNRILRVGGLVYLSTDYWEEPLEGSGFIVPSGSYKNTPLPWSIFDRSSVERLLDTIEDFGFRVYGGREIPPCKDRPVVWQGQRYTFIAMEIEKVDDGW